MVGYPPPPKLYCSNIFLPFALGTSSKSSQGRRREGQASLPLYFSGNHSEAAFPQLTSRHVYGLPQTPSLPRRRSWGKKRRQGGLEPFSRRWGAFPSSLTLYIPSSSDQCRFRGVGGPQQEMPPHTCGLPQPHDSTPQATCKAGGPKSPPAGNCHLRGGRQRTEFPSLLPILKIPGH